MLYDKTLVECFCTISLLDVHLKLFVLIQSQYHRHNLSNHIKRTFSSVFILGIREVCDMEKALGILWKKTIAGRFSAHPCPRGAKGISE